MIKTQKAPLNNDQIIDFAPAAGATVPHQDVSSKYSFVPTLEAVDILRDTGWLPITAKQSAVRKDDRKGFQKHIIRFTKAGLSFNGERVDLVLINSHDRGTSFQLIASVWRKVCGNGLMVPAKFANFSHRHMGFDGVDFAKSAKNIASSAGRIAERVDDFKAIELTLDEKGVFASAAHSLIYDDQNLAPIKPENLLEERRYDDEGNDLWTTFNVIQENIIKGGIRGHKRGSNGRVRRVTTRPVKSIDKDLKLNRALWMLTEKMGQLKAV